MQLVTVRHRHRGAPPRSWGQFLCLCCLHNSCRFTPTLVGTMQASAHKSSWAAVHPHARGDNNLLFALDRQNLGSPPRSWGQFHMRREASRITRFTPTLVGTMFVVASVVIVSAVHPHARGDNARAGLALLGCVGSPPRPWGQYQPVSSMALALRFTPTPVGTMTTHEERS